jgi:hypothetical protein
MTKLCCVVFLAGLPMAHAGLLSVTLSFTGTGFVGATPFTDQTVTVQATVDTANVFTFKQNFEYDVLNALTVGVSGFGTGAASTLSGWYIGNNTGSGTYFFGNSTFGDYIDASDAALAGWEAQTPIGPIAVPDGQVLLNDSDTWGANGIDSSIGRVEVTAVTGLTITATGGVPEPASLGLIGLGIATVACRRIACRPRPNPRDGRRP